MQHITSTPIGRILLIASCMLCTLLAPQVVQGHSSKEHRTGSTRHWSVVGENRTVDASFLFYKNGVVALETDDHAILKYPLDALSKPDQAFVLDRFARIQALNREPQAIPQRQLSEHSTSSPWLGLFIGAIALMLAIGVLFHYTWARGRKAVFVGAGALLAVALVAFKEPLGHLKSLTDPYFLDAAFDPFKPKVATSWDNDYFYVESLGIPEHEMMTGITNWQRQVPIPQCYVGSNAWPIPLNPVIAATPVPVSADHFVRGAIALAVNGVPIFNPFTNTGVDAFLDGQLDNYGGHCGRADDYHYHTAPLSLYGQTTDTLPIAFALDGFAVYGSQEPEGVPMTPLDANHGHYGVNGVYHYHGTANAPYMIGNMVGQVTEDVTLQIVPQAHANPVRPAQNPLPGAAITGCVPNGTNDGYTVTYTLNGQTDSIVYSWTSGGVYSFSTYTQGVGTPNTYNGFTPCTITTSVDEATRTENDLLIYPVPTTSGFSLQLGNGIQEQDITEIAIYNMSGSVVYKTDRYQSHIDTPGLQQGTYLVKIQLRGYQVIKKLVVR